jgi:hypothetical protein
MSAPSQITADALASINYAAFNQGSLNAKQRRARMLKDFLVAHGTGAQEIADEWMEEHKALWATYLHASHAPHSREIQRLTTHAQQIELWCQQRLQHANAVTRCALSGIEELLTRLTESGMSISADTGVLTGEPDPFLATSVEANAQQAEEHGTPLAEVRGFDPSKPDPHPPAFRFAEADRAEVTRLKDVFERAAESITSRKENGSCVEVSLFASPRTSSSGTENFKGPGAVSSSPTTDNDSSRETSGAPVKDAALLETAPPSASTDADEERLRQVDELHRELDAVGDAFVALMKRVELQHHKYQAKIAAQRDALDAAATQTKLADDVLRGIVAQGEVEASSAVAEVQQLSLELRRRMDASEVAMRSALDTLIKESAEVCVANDALYDYSALTLNRENCLYAYMSRMERQVVEQASVLREAQDMVTRLWSRLRTPASQRQQAQPQSETGAKNGSVGSALATSNRKGRDGATSFPPLYLELLQQSDRASLLDVAERLTRLSDEAAALVVRVLDEHQARDALHPVEAAAAREAHQRTVATQQLLEKLDAEGYLRSSARQTTLPLSERIAHLISQYDAYIDFNEQYARALVRQADVERREQALSQFALFDARTPVPQLKNATAAPPRSAPPPSGNTNTVPKVRAGISATTQQLAAASADAGSATTLPYLQLWESKQREARQRQRELPVSASGIRAVDASTTTSTGKIVSYQERGSGQPRVAFDLAPSPPAAFTGGGRGGVGGPVTAPPSSALHGRRHTAIGATASTCESSTPPPPPVPPRAGLTSYVLSTYATNAGDASTDSGAAGQNLTPGRRSTIHALPYRDGDRQFIERQREVFRQLDEVRPGSCSHTYAVV